MSVLKDRLGDSGLAITGQSEPGNDFPNVQPSPPVMSHVACPVYLGNYTLNLLHKYLGMEGASHLAQVSS